ncbi:MAG TPA: hypothetical protein VGM49_05540 [Candidatus Limnocylindrales bacterium]|jgi:hypothetical protein
MRWHRQLRLPLISEQVFADAGGLQFVRVRADTTLVRLPPWLPDLDRDLIERDDGQAPLLEVLDLGRAANQLRGLGIAIGAIQEDGSEALVPIEFPGIGRFRLVGSWLPGWEEEFARIRRERSGS